VTTKLDAAYNRRQIQLRERATGALHRLFVERDDFDNEEAWLEEAAPIASGGTSSAAALASAWIAYTLGTKAVELSDRATQPYKFEDRYGTPLQAALAVMSNGGERAAALEAGAKRASDVLDVDMQLSGVRGAREQGKANGVTRWQRIPEPEACELCTLAADRVYKTDDLAPLHRDCGCWVEPIT
jgi:hypothetical protein